MPAAELQVAEAARAEATGRGAAAELARVSESAMREDGWEAPSGPGSSATGDGHASLAVRSGLLTLALHVGAACEAGLEGTDMPVAGFEGVMAEVEAEGQDHGDGGEGSRVGELVVMGAAGQAADAACMLAAWA